MLLLSLLRSREAALSRSFGLGDQRLEQVVLLRPVALVHVHQPALVEGADDGGVFLGQLLLKPAKKDALNVIPNVADMPAVRTVVGVLKEGTHL